MLPVVSRHVLIHETTACDQNVFGQVAVLLTWPGMAHQYHRKLLLERLTPALERLQLQEGARHTHALLRAMYLPCCHA